MVRDYHIHSQILQQEELFSVFAETAVKNGIQEICVTDHMPLTGRRDSDRIPQGKVAEYCEKVRKLAESWRGRLSVKAGIEIDYHPSVTEEIDAVLKEGDFDFVLGSSHLHAIPSAEIFRRVRTRREYAAAMLENTIAAAVSGYFDAIAHVDMYRWIFSLPSRFPLEDDGFCEEEFSGQFDRMLDAVKAAGLRLELNPHFAAATGNTDDIYPSYCITSLALEKGIPFSFGSDAHVPEQVGICLPQLRQHPVYAKALQTWECDNQ